MKEQDINKHLRRTLIATAGLALALGVATPANATEFEGQVSSKDVAGCHVDLVVKDYDSTQTYYAQGVFYADSSVNNGDVCHMWLERRTLSGGYQWTQVSGMHYLHDSSGDSTYWYWDGPGYRVEACAAKFRASGAFVGQACTSEY
ncbi:hypothetical protein ACFYNO_03315 [Kitasatospora sp. NPDC006697]|uniref:hypothetical protein n=1 Tax=Kitasatospora sp. NPDC006697 TaxID=3364020 RepID=UPI0036CF4C90